MGKKSLILALVILLAGCDVVTSRYETYAEAAAEELFGRGWLPEIIPQSSSKIVTSNDLDLNLSWGEFWFQEADAAAFISKLKPYAGRPSPYENYEKTVTKRMRQGYEPYEYVEGSAIWTFFLNKKKGHAYYDLWFERRSS